MTNAALPLMNDGVMPVGVFAGFTGLADDERFDRFDTSEIVDVGAVYGEVNLEALAELDPDLVVTHAYPIDASGEFDPDEPLYGFADTAQQEQVAEIAPIAAIGMAGSAVDVIERSNELALALGADPAVIDAGRAEFDAAAAALTAAADPAIEVAAAYAETDNVWLAKAPDDPALRMYADFGVAFVDPGGDGFYWEVLSWETFPDLPFDVVLYSPSGLDPAAMNEIATFAIAPAAQAGQLHPWTDIGMDYVSAAAYMNELAAWLAAADDVA